MEENNSSFNQAGRNITSSSAYLSFTEKENMRMFTLFRIIFLNFVWFKTKNHNLIKHSKQPLFHKK